MKLAEWILLMPLPEPHPQVLWVLTANGPRFPPLGEVVLDHIEATSAGWWPSLSPPSPSVPLSPTLQARANGQLTWCSKPDPLSTGQSRALRGQSEASYSQRPNPCFVLPPSVLCDSLTPSPESTPSVNHKNPHIRLCSKTAKPKTAGSELSKPGKSWRLMFSLGYLWVFSTHWGLLPADPLTLLRFSILAAM